MSEITDIIKEHLEKYPEMEIGDLFKLIYQNEYGGGFAASNPELSLRQIEADYEKINSSKRKPKTDLIEDIGNGFVRVNLGALNPETFPLEKLNEACIATAEKYRGNRQALRDKVKEVRDHFAEFDFEFEEVTFVLFSSAMEEACYPPIDHSETYRVLYKPAYRVVKKELLEDIIPEAESVN